MPAPTIIRGKDHFSTVIYEGNGEGQRVGNFLPVTHTGSANGSIAFDDQKTMRLEKDYGDTTASSGGIFTYSGWFQLGYSSVNYPLLINFNENSQPYDYFMFNKTSASTGGILQYYSYGSSAYNIRRITNTTIEASDKFYHIVLRVDTSQSTADDRCRIYIDGEKLTSFTADYANPSQGFTATGFGQASAQFNIGSVSTSNKFDGHVSQLILCDGQSYGPETFAQTDTSTGRWVPKEIGSITYGNRGFRLDFGAPADLGNDSSGNNNDYTAVGLPLTATHTLSSPTKEYPVLDDYQGSYLGSYANAQMRVTGSTSSQSSMGRSTVSFDVEDSTGYYAEFKNLATSSFGSNFNGYGIVGTEADGVSPSSGSLFPNGGPHVMLQEDGNVRIRMGKSSAEQNLGAATLPKTGNTSTSDTVGVAVKSGKIWFAKNGIWGNSNQGNPNSDGTPIVSGLKGRFRFSAALYQTNATQEVNFGQRKILGGTATSDYSANNGGFFAYPPPTGFRALTKDSVPDTEDKTGISRSSEGIADLVWIKNRDATDAHQLYDSSRGPLIDQQTNTNATDSTTTDGLQQFLKGGFSIEDDVSINTSGESYVAWMWHANGGTTSANTDGSGATLASTIQANQDAGFSIVTYTGNETAGAKVAHGLSQAPEWLWIHCRSLATGGKIYHHKNTAAPATDYLALNTTDATYDAAYLNDTAPDAKCFTLGGTGLGSNNDSATYMAYCWHGVEGFSKFGKFKGNASTTGPYVYLGFKPAWVMFKNTNASTNWVVWDNARTPFNPIGTGLLPNDTNADTANFDIDFNASGFRLRDSESTLNGNTNTIVYFAFAEHPFIGNGTNPVTAF